MMIRSANSRRTYHLSLTRLDGRKARNVKSPQFIPVLTHETPSSMPLLLHRRGEHGTVANEIGSTPGY